MNKFEEYKINLPEKNKKIITDYLEKVKKIIQENNLEKELYSDIEERVFEKLSIHKKLNQLQVKQTLNEIGDPEDIFEIEDKTKSFNFLIFLKTLKNKTESSVSKIFETGFNFKNFFTFIKTMFLNLLSLTKRIFFKLLFFIKKIILKVIQFIKYLIILSRKLLKVLWKLILIVFNYTGSFIGYIILLGAISLLFIAPIIYKGIDIGNINYIASIPKDLIISYYLLSLFIGVIGLYFIIKKYFLIHFIIASVALFIMLGFGFVGGSNFYNNHQYEGEISQNYSLNNTKEFLTVKSKNVNIYGNTYIFDDIIDYDIEVKPSIDENINIKIVSKIYTKNEETFKKVEENLNDFELKIKDDSLLFKVKNGELFKEKSNFVPIYREITIYIPEKTVLDFGYYGYYKLSGENLSKCLKSRKHNGEFSVGTVYGKIICIKQED